MSEENARHSTCGSCCGRIDDVKDIGRIRWYHCEKCGGWSASVLKIENGKDESNVDQRQGEPCKGSTPDNDDARTARAPVQPLPATP